jgi:protein gp37
MGGKTGARYAGLTLLERSGPRWTGEMRVAEDLLAWPLYQRRPRRIGVNVMSDLFHEGLDREIVDLVHAVMAAAHWHRFLVLTKRSARMRDYYRDPQTRAPIGEKLDLLSSVLVPLPGRRTVPLDESAIRPALLGRWPMANLWLGVSIEDQDRIFRVRDLLDTPAALRWVCFEPLLGRVRPDIVPAGDGYFDALAGGHFIIDGRSRRITVDGPAWPPLDWVVAGGEIGAGARQTQPAWLRELRDNCLASRVPFYFRQWGEWAPASPGTPDAVARIGKRAAGRVLDGRIWDEIPAPG